MDDILQQSILTNFFEAYESNSPVADEIATRVTSKGRSNKYDWIGQLPGLRKMLGERVPQKLSAYTYTLENEEYEASIEVKRADIKDDETGKYLVQAREIGGSVKEYPDEAIFGDLLPNGVSNVAYDGQNFFDTDHPVGTDGEVQSNLFTLALNATNFETVYSALRNLKGDHGKRVNKKLDVRLVVPVALEATARALVEAKQTVTGGGAVVDNPHYGKAKVIVATELEDADAWYLINVAGEVRAFIIQEREFIPFEALEDGSEKAWWNKKFYYGTYWRGAFGYGLYHKAVASIPS